MTRQQEIQLAQAWSKKEEAGHRRQKALERMRTALTDVALEEALGDLRKAWHDQKVWSIVHTRLWQLYGEPA